MTDSYFKLSTVQQHLVGLLFMILFDVVINSIVLFCDMQSDLSSNPSKNNVDTGLMRILAIVFIALQLLLNLILIFWYFLLVWKTFPFRFGLLKKLILEEFPVLIVVPINFILFVAERFLRLYYL